MTVNISSNEIMLLDVIDRLKESVEQSDSHVRKLTSMLNRACHIGIEKDLTGNEKDELNDYLDYIQNNHLLDW